MQPNPVEVAVPAPAPSTRQWLIDVAQREIAARGFSGVTMRGIAARANVDPSLVRHFFGSKQNLLLQAVHVATDSDELVAEALRGTSAGVGRRTVQLLLDVCDNPRAAAGTLGGLSAALIGPDGSAMSEATFLRPLLTRITTVVSPDHHDLRAGLVGAQMVAVVIGRYLVGDPVLSASTAPDLARIVGRSVQRQLVGPLPWAPDEAVPEAEPTPTRPRLVSG